MHHPVSKTLIPVRETKKIFVVISCSSDRSPIIPCGWYGLDIPSFKSFVENVEFQATFIESVRRHQPREGYPIPATALRLILDGSASLERSYERVHDILFPSLRLETLILASQLRGLAGSLGYVSQPAKTVKPDDVRFVRCPYTQSRQSIEPSRHPLQRKETPKRRSRRSVIPARILLDELIPIARGERLILKLMGYS